MKRFKRIYIEITNVCNLSCAFCPKTSRDPFFMKSENFNYIIDQVAPYTDHIYLHLLGEPLMHPELENILELNYKKSLKVNITTNGTLIDKAKDILINSNSIRQINYSLHSFEANTYNDSMENYINKILDFILISKEKTSLINSLRLWNLPPRTKDIEENSNTSSMGNLLIYNIISERFNLSEDIRDELLREGGIKLTEKVYLNLSHKFQWPDKTIPLLNETGFCYGLRDHLGILVDGTVVPCCLDNEGTINLGNIFETNFSNILDSPKALAIYEGFSRREVVDELCKRCQYRQRFN